MTTRAAWLVGLLLIASIASAQKPDPVASAPQVLTLESAVHFALENNPALAAQRQQHGIAAAKVVIADTYPFNPILENRIQGAGGPPAAGILQDVPVEHILVWEVELRGQRRFRRQGAAAGLARTDWEIARQEQLLAIQVVRAYEALVYRREKLKLIEETVAFNRRLVDDVKRLMDLGKLKSDDLIMAQTEVTDTLDLVGGGREALVAARQEIYRALGTCGGEFDVEGTLETPAEVWDAEALTQLACSRRADLQARRAATQEAAANRRLAIANRKGNPSVGPAFTYDPTKIHMIGAQINLPLPFPNRHRGEIMQSEAEEVRAALELRQAEVEVCQDVAAALAKLDATEKRAETYRSQALPDLRRAVEDMEKLFQAGDVNLLKVIDVRRKLLKARDSYLDALWSVRQARADLLAATGEPVLAFCK
jgi:cobalt-zinc-cadmium efflux system outer membrane protein